MLYVPVGHAGVKGYTLFGKSARYIKSIVKTKIKVTPHAVMHLLTLPHLWKPHVPCLTYVVIMCVGVPH